jgi:hypothetical protein
MATTPDGSGDLILSILEVAIVIGILISLIIYFRHTKPPIYRLIVFIVRFVRERVGKTPQREPTQQESPAPPPSQRARPTRPPAHPPALSIFISYRRDDSAGYAGRLYDRLRSRFAKDRLFMDIDNIPPGHDFVEVLEAAIAACNVVLVLIGKQWVSITNADGTRRLDDPNDFVRLEIATALRRNVRVIPVLVRGATMPLESALPPDVRPLARRQALAISDDDFHHDADRLIAAINAAD